MASSRSPAAPAMLEYSGLERLDFLRPSCSQDIVSPSLCTSDASREDEESQDTSSSSDGELEVFRSDGSGEADGEVSSGEAELEAVSCMSSNEMSQAAIQAIDAIRRTALRFPNVSVTALEPETPERLELYTRFLALGFRREVVVGFINSCVEPTADGGCGDVPAGKLLERDLQQWSLLYGKVVQDIVEVQQRRMEVEKQLACRRMYLDLQETLKQVQLLEQQNLCRRCHK
eukprot:RCo019917